MGHETTDVVIVGAGPGGLAAAHAITTAAPQLKVTVFERSTASISNSRRGAGLGLDVNGQKALQAINPDLLAKVLETASLLHANKVLKPDGTTLAEVPFGQGMRKEFADRGYKTPCLLGWSELQQLLAEALPPSVTVHTGMEFERYESHNDSVTAYFRPVPGQTNGTTAHTPASTAATEHPPSPPAAAMAAAAAVAVPDSPVVQQSAQGVAVTAHLLVASDGYFSRVRRQCLADGLPEWGETLVYRARLPSASAAAAGVVLGDSSVFVQDVGRFLFAYPISSGDVVWTIGVSDAKLQELGLDSAAIRQQLYKHSSPSSNTTNHDHHPSSSSSSPQPNHTVTQDQGYSPQETAAGRAARARCLQVLTGMWAPLLRLVEATPAASLVEHGVYTRPASSMSHDCFGRGRVVIIGDAAHPLRPTGQGLNQTLEDAWGLGKAVKLGCLAGDGSEGGGVELHIQQEQLQQFRRQRAQRVAPVVAFTTESGKAAYTAAKDREGQDSAKAAAAALGQDGVSMTAEQFSEYCCSMEFEALSAVTA